jgi:tRNA(fMet)-specific endonuclease VapC
MIALDSDVVIEILDKKSQKGEEALKRALVNGEELCIPVISVHEVLYGLHKFGKSSKELMQLPVLEYTKNDAALSSQIELQAEKEGKPIKRTDAMIATIAINNNATLFTFNLKHFEPLKKQGLMIFY